MNAISCVLFALCVLQQIKSIQCFYSEAEFQAFAAKQGISIRRSNLGPAFRFVARTLPTDASTENDETSISVGYLEGIVRSPILQLDSIRVSKPKLKQARVANTAFRGGGTVFGVSLLLGYASVLYGLEQCKCPNAEFLAIDDSELQHKRLVKFYSNAGFQTVKYVGDGVFDIPDRLVWGGCGTLLRQDCEVLLENWTELFEKADARRMQRLEK